MDLKQRKKESLWILNAHTYFVAYIKYLDFGAIILIMLIELQFTQYFAK